MTSLITFLTEVPLNGIKTISLLCYTLLNGSTRNWPGIGGTGIGIGLKLEGTGLEWWRLESKLAHNRVRWTRTQLATVTEGAHHV